MASAEGDLERDLVAVLERTCLRARELSVKPEGLGQEEARRLIRRDDYLDFETELEIDWEQLSSRLASAPGLWEELTRVVRGLEEGTLIALSAGDYETGAASPAQLWRLILIPILKCYHARRPSWEWDENLARELLAEWEAAQTSRSNRYHRTIAPLHYFEGPDEVVALDRDLVIRPLTDSDREALWRGNNEEGLSPVVLEGWSHTIDYRWQEPEGELNGWEDPLASHEVGHDGVRDAVRALRLHHPGMAETTLVWSRPDPPDEPGGLFDQALLSIPKDAEYDIDIDEDAYFGTEYPPRTRIEVSDGEALARLLQGLRAGRDDRRLALALRRFDSAYSRYESEDSLIDLWIAFEALLLPDGQAELSYRAALRIAQLTADEDSERREAFRQARLSYKCRSQVVHGEAAAADLDEVVEQTRELARKVLRAWILDPPPGGIEQVDQSIFGS